MDQVIPAGEVRRETKAANSRFIATLAPAFSVEEARSFITRIRNEFPDATHNVPAFRVGHGSTVVEHCSDDGEPSGTAGRPILQVLRGSGFGDLVVVVTRYFGGTKLGTGGLVRAYTEAVKDVLGITPRASRIPTLTVNLQLSYTFYERFQKLVEKNQGTIIDATFTDEVRLTLYLPETNFLKFEGDIIHLTSGQVRPIVMHHDLRIYRVE